MPYNLVKLPKFSLECKRGNVSSAAAAALANSLVNDFHNAGLLINTENLIFDERKIDREKKRVQKFANAQYFQENQNVICIWVDGKIDKQSLIVQKIGDQSRRYISDEHHLTFTAESGKNKGRYLHTLNFL